MIAASRRPGIAGGLLVGVLLVPALSVPALSEGARAAEAFEAPSLEASELLPADLLRGPHYAVEDEVETDGFLPVFTVTSEFGRFEARGEAGLRERIREIQALAALREASQAAKSKVPGGGTPGVRTPAATGAPVAGLPAGAFATAPKPGRLIFAAGDGAGGFSDLDSMKRKVAQRLGIDPYTSNPALQRELQQHVWAAWSGGLSSPFADDAGNESITDELARADELVLDYSAEDLRRLQRLELTAMGVEEPLREKFLEHPYYTSRHGARLLDSLSELEDTADRAAFIEAAVAARSSEEARGFERMAELLRRYGRETGSLERFLTVDGRVAAHAGDGTLIVPVLAEHCAWTQGVASFAESLARSSGAAPGVVRTKLLVSGSLSDRARSEMEKLGLSVKERGLSDPEPPAD